jgi:MscS family membrane protein
MDKLKELLLQGFAPLQPYPYLQALLVIILFGALAIIVDKLISGICTRLVANTKSNIDDQLVEILHRPVFTSVAMVGLVIATYRLEFGDDLRNTTIAVLQTILIIIWITSGLRLSRIVITAMGRQEKSFSFVQQSTEPLLANALAVFLFLAGVYAILVAWDINVTGLVASAGILGLALSFAAQDTLSNLFAGVAILADRPYKIGDFIVLDSGERGQVTNIGLRSTRLLTRDDVEVSIPNGVMGHAKIINEAGGPPRRYRVRVSVGVAYGSDIDKVMEILLAIAEDHAKIFSTPEPRARFRQFGESSLDFELLCWIERPADKGLVCHELNYQIYKRFSNEGVQIPFPQRDLYIKQMPQ